MSEYRRVYRKQKCKPVCIKLTTSDNVVPSAGRKEAQGGCRSRAKEPAGSFWVGNGSGKEPCARPSRPVPSTPLLSSHCCQTCSDPWCSALFSALWQEPQQVPIAPCPAWKSKGGAVSFPTHAALTPICLVCLIQPLCPLSVSPPGHPPQPGCFTPLLSVLTPWFTA